MSLLDNTPTPGENTERARLKRDEVNTADHVQCALVKVIDALKGLPREERVRVVRSAQTFFDDPVNGVASIRR